MFCHPGICLSLGGPEMDAQGRLHLNGKEFVRGGAHWPDSPLEAARESSDETLLAVYGWDGVIHMDKPISAGFGSDLFDGNYYANLYDAKSGAALLALTGRFQGVDPRELFVRSAWVGDRYYVLPLDKDYMSRFVLCDMHRPEAAAK